MTPEAALIGQQHNVKAYNAAGDGLTDDTAAFKAALADAAAHEGAVYVPDGQYLISDGLVCAAAVTLMGESWNAVLIRRKFTGVLVNLTGADSRVVRLSINGSGSTVGSLFAEIEISGANSVIEVVRVIDTLHVGIAVAGDHCTVRSCTVAGLGTAPAQQQGYGIWACAYNTGVVIEDNNVTGTGIDGIGVSGVGFRVSGNNVSNCHGFAGEGGGQIVVYNDKGTTRDGIVADNVVGPGNAACSGGLELNGTDISVTGNEVSFQKLFGICVDSGNGWNFNGNTVTNSGQGVPGSKYAWQGAALAIPAGCSGFSITGNRLADDQATPTQTCGVYVWPGASDDYVITGNILTGNTVAPLFDGGTGANKLVTNNLGA